VRKVVKEYLRELEDMAMYLLLNLFRSLLNMISLDLVVELITSMYICLPLNKAIRGCKQYNKLFLKFNT
jgi:hypothetical protein